MYLTQYRDIVFAYQMIPSKFGWSMELLYAQYAVLLLLQEEKRLLCNMKF